MIELLILSQGIIRAIYTESLAIHSFGHVQIERASHVEPDADGHWWADLEPSRGPRLGPFTHRSQALEAEHDWLTEHVLFGPSCRPLTAENPPDV